MIRSYLFVPANRPDRCTKAVASEADAVIVDLEDAIPGDQKDAARAALINWLSPAHSVFIRINGTQTKWFQDDLSACRHPGVRGVVLPKADEVTDIETTASQLNSGQTVLPMVESALAFSNISHLASAKSVSRLLFGSLDLQIDLGMNAEEDELLYFRSQLVIASRIAGIEPPVDGISPTFTDRDRIELDADARGDLVFPASSAFTQNKQRSRTRSFCQRRKKSDGRVG